MVTLKCKVTFSKPMLQIHLTSHNPENEKAFKMKMKIHLFFQDIYSNKMLDWRTAIRYCNKMPIIVSSFVAVHPENNFNIY